MLDELDREILKSIDGKESPAISEAITLPEGYSQSASVQECPAYYLCKSAGAFCDDCLEMTVDQWRTFVKTVLGRPPLEISEISSE